MDPAPHAYAAPGEYLVTVAVFYEKQSTSTQITVTVDVCSSSGNVVASHWESQVGPGTGSWIWDGKINGVDATKGICTSRVYASHPF